MISEFDLLVKIWNKWLNITCFEFSNIKIPIKDISHCVNVKIDRIRNKIWNDFINEHTNNKSIIFYCLNKAYNIYKPNLLNIYTETIIDTSKYNFWLSIKDIF